MVFYRKYRPQKISELDLVAVRGRLESILSQKEIPHAFLFTGSKGLGKTSTARILAKAINCQNRHGIEPCNECEICKSITVGSNLDVLEIDAASNRGIDEIRELRERIKFSPAALSKKVYIIDEVHMLTTDAFNALLKTLEEPPSHAIFILCTTELEKIPPTITSRTFHITFQKPSVEEAVSSLKRVVKGEKLVVEDEVLREILVYSEDSFRDATKILQELSITTGGKPITKEILESTYNTGNMDAICRGLLISLSEKNVKESLVAIQNLADAGTDFKVVTEKLTNILHGIILLRNGITKEGRDIKEIKTDSAHSLLELINDSYRDIKVSVLPQIPLEIVAIEWCQEKTENAKLKIINSVEETEFIPSPKKEENTVADTVAEEKAEKNDVNEKKIEIADDKKIEDEKEVPDAKLDDVDSKDNVGMFSKNVLPETFFQALIERVKRDNHSIAGILRGCRLVELSDEKATFEAKYKFHKDKLNEAKTIEILDRRASELLNRNIKVTVAMVAK